MFGLFKKKDPIETLQKKYEQLLKESYELSHKDRRAADLKTAEADEVLQEIERLKAEKGE
ncbi:MAG: Lacal_2735 family protein [Bernardetiaceae bacterium]